MLLQLEGYQFAAGRGVFGKLFKRGKQAARQTTYTGYPPPDPGIEVVHPRQLVDEQGELIYRCQRALGLPPDEYKEVIEPVIVRMASYVHRLPASQAHHHSLPGGLFRHSLEVAYGTLQGTEGVILTSMQQGTPSQRRNQSIRWRGAAFMAGLVHDVAKVHTDLRVSDKAGHEWNPMLGPLYSWAKKLELERYYISYREQRHKRHETSSSPFLQFVITQKFYVWLDSDGGDIMLSLLGALSGTTPDHTLAQLVVRADQRSVERDLRVNQASQSTRPGIPIATYLMDAMRRLVQSGSWTVNRRGARVWIVDDGGNRFAHVAWYQGAEDLIGLLGRDRIPGIPRNPATLADILIERDLAEPYTLPDGEGESRYWPITGGPLGNKVLYTLRLPADVVFPEEAPAQPTGLQVGDPTQHTEKTKGGQTGGADAPPPTPQLQTERHGEQGSTAVSEFEWPDAGGGKKEPPDEAKSRSDEAPARAAVAMKDGEAASDAQALDPQEDHAPVKDRGDRQRGQDSPPRQAGEDPGRGEAAKRDDAAEQPTSQPPRKGDAKKDKDDAGGATRPRSSAKPGSKAGTRESTQASDSPEEALAWLEQHGDAEGVAARWLSRLVQEAPEGVVTTDGRELFLSWPQAAKGYGEPKKLLMAVYDAGWLEASGLAGKISKKDGKPALIIKRRATKRLKVLMGDRAMQSGNDKDNSGARGHGKAESLMAGSRKPKRDDNAANKEKTGGNQELTVDIAKLCDELYEISEQMNGSGGRLVRWEQFDELADKHYPRTSKYKIITKLKGAERVLDTSREGVLLKQSQRDNNDA